MSKPENNSVSDVSPQQKSALLLLFVTFFIDILGVGLVITLNPYYVQKYPFFLGHRVNPGIAVGLLTACYPALQLVCAPFWGRLSDRIGRRPIILLSLVGNSLTWLLFGLARSLEMLFLARMLSGVLSSASLPTVQAYIADSTPPEKRSVWIGIVVGMGFSFGFMLGPGIGGYLGSVNLSYPAFLASGIAFVNFLAAWRRLPESLSDENRALAAEHRPQGNIRQLAHALSIPRIGTMLLILGSSTFAMQSMEQNLVLWGNKVATTTVTLDGWDELSPSFIRSHAVFQVDFSPTNPPPSSVDPRLVTPDQILTGSVLRVHRHLIPRDTGLILTLVAFVVGMIQGGALKRFVPRFGERNLIVGGSVIGALGFFLIPVATTFPALLLASSIIAVGISFITPCLRGLISQDAAAHAQGSVLGVSESVRSLAMTAGPLVGGALFDAGPSLPFNLGGLCMALCFVLAASVRTPRRD